MFRCWDQLTGRNHFLDGNQKCFVYYVASYPPMCTILSMITLLEKLHKKHACFMHATANFMRTSPCMFHACATYNVHACFMFHAWNMWEIGTFFMHETCMSHACYMNAINHECTMHEPCMHGLVVEKAFCCVKFLVDVCVMSTSWKTILDSQ